MSSIKHDNDVGLAEFTAGWRTAFSTWLDNHWLAEAMAVIGLTNFGERPVPSARLAEVLGRPLGETEALARRWGWPGTLVEDGLITVNPERAKSAARRHVQVGGRRFGVTGCGPDIFFYAPLVRPSLHLEETCTVTGTPIRIVVTPSGVERVEPAGAVVALPHPQECTNGVEAAARCGDIDDLDASLCGQTPLYSSAEAAQGWLAAHPGGRALPIREAWDLFRPWREGMSALLNVGH